MPTWTTMNDLSTGDLVTEADMDAIRGNIEYLLNPNEDNTAYLKGSNISATNNTWQDVDATNLSLTITTYGGPVLIYFSGMAYVAASNIVYFDIDINGTRYANTTKGIAKCFQTYAIGEHVAFAVIDNSLAAGSHTITLQWCGSTTNGQNLLSASGETPVILGVIEL